MSMFPLIVSLFRACGRPNMAAGVFRYEGPATQELLDLARACEGLDNRYGSLNEFDDDEQLVIEYRLPRSSDGAFYPTFEEYVRQARTLGKGVASDAIYIVADDWSPFDRESDVRYERVRSVCRLIGELSSLANWADDKSSDSHISLYFSLPADKDKPPRNIVIPTKFSEEFLGFDIKNNRLVSNLVSESNKDKLHMEERRLLFGMALADLAERCPQGEDVFLHILSSWGVVLSIYRNGLQAYLYGFSFDKIRTEIAKAEIEFASKLSSVLGDISGKLLALPVSVAGVVVLHKLSLGVEFYAGIVGVLLVSLILIMILWNQWLQIGRLKHSFEVVFGQFRAKIGSYPKPLRVTLQKAISHVDRQSGFLSFTFWFFMVLALVPLLCVLIVWDSKAGWPVLSLVQSTLELSWHASSRVESRAL